MAKLKYISLRHLKYNLITVNDHCFSSFFCCFFWFLGSQAYLLPQGASEFSFGQQKKKAPQYS